MDEKKPITILDGLTNPEDIKMLDDDQMEQLASELREMIIDSVSQTGGHLASNLGVVELTLALLTTLDVPTDRVIWDVGHQSYAYKILTDRRDEFGTLRQAGGLSGFPKREESHYDSFNTGHSSTSISAAIGLSRALRAQGDHSHVVAVIGDGALTGGMAYEALNNLTPDDRVIVILNDNQMSISKNVGGLTKHLEQLRVSSRYLLFKKQTQKWAATLPRFGRRIVSALNHTKNLFRRLVSRQLHTVFDVFDVKYYGPINGHDISRLQDYVTAAKQLDSSVVIHICTQKGRGYRHAEEAPENYHGVAPFIVERGVETSEKRNGDLSFPESLPYSGSFTSAFSQGIIDLAADDPRIVAVCAAMEAGTGLHEFHKRWPERFYDVGIAEQHAVTMASGLAAGGLKPVVALYSSFMQRALDQLIHDAALQNLPVVFCLDRSGVVGADGETHQGIYELSFLRSVPNLEVLSPRDYTELYLMLRYALAKDSGPTAIRYPRGGVEMPVEALDRASFNTNCRIADAAEAGSFKPVTLRKGKGTAILTWGNQCGRVLKAVEYVTEKDASYDPVVIDIRTLKPLDESMILRALVKNSQDIIVVEETAAGSDIGSEIGSLMAEHRINCSFLRINLGSELVLQGKAKDVLETHGLGENALGKRLLLRYRETLQRTPRLVSGMGLRSAGKTADDISTTGRHTVG